METSSILYALPLVVVLTFGIWLSAVDLREHRLPNRIVAAAGLALVPSILHFENLGQLFMFATSYFGIYLSLFLLSRGQMGFGDVKYAAVLGLAVGCYTSRLDQLVAFTFISAGLVTAMLLLLGRITLRSHIAFGPFMTFGALITIAVTL